MAAEDPRLDELLSEIPEDERAGIKEGVNNFLKDVKKEDMQNLRAVLMSTGWPTVKDALFAIIDNNVHSEKNKKLFKNRVMNLEETHEKACLSFTYTNIKTGKTEVKQFSFLPCDVSYDYQKNVGYLEKECGSEKFAELIQLVGKLIHVINLIYMEVLRNNIPFIKEIAPETYRSYGGIHVDQTNNTLFVDKTWSNRFGLKII